MQANLAGEVFVDKVRAYEPDPSKQGEIRYIYSDITLVKYNNKVLYIYTNNGTISKSIVQAARRYVENKNNQRREYIPECTKLTLLYFIYMALLPETREEFNRVRIEREKCKPVVWWPWILLLLLLLIPLGFGLGFGLTQTSRTIVLPNVTNTSTTTMVPTTTTTTMVPTTTTTMAPLTTGINTTTTTTTTSMPTTPAPIFCGLTNPSFDAGSLVGWTTGSSIAGGGPSVIGPPTSCQNGLFCMFTGIAQSASPPTCTMPMGTAQLYQNWFMFDCTLSISFWYTTTAAMQPFENTDLVQAYIRQQNGGAIVATLFSFPIPFGTIPYTQYTFNVCDGSCGGVDLTPFVGQTLSISVEYLSQSIECGGTVWDNFCVQ